MRTTFDWVQQVLDLEPDSPLYRLATRDGKGARTLKLPNLAHLPDPLSKARFLLHTAAEVEHQLLAQYLYAAWSVRHPAEAGDAAARRLLADWHGNLMDVAREEMGHLMTVQNLLLLLEQPVHLGRGSHDDLHPFAMHLEPLSRASLARYVLAESPPGAGEEWAGDLARVRDEAGADVNQVAVIYLLLGLVFCRDQAYAASNAEGAGLADSGAGPETWFAMIRDLAPQAYQQGLPETWHLPDEAFHGETLDWQAMDDGWGPQPDVHVHHVTDRDDALHALWDISLQGEGPTVGPEPSHFTRFLAMFEEYPDWDPAHPVPRDPSAASITHPRANRWARLADLRYGMLLGFLQHWLESRGENRDLLRLWTFREMRKLDAVARRLATLPRSEEGPERAGAPLALPDPLPATEPERWALHKQRFQESLALAQEMFTGDEGGDPFLMILLGEDEQFWRGIP